MQITETKASAFDLKPGYIGFVSRKADFISAGIDFFEAWDRLPGDVPVSHTLVYCGPVTTIEALAHGVVQGSVANYLDDPDCALLVRRPLGYTDELGERIVNCASSHMDEKYDDWLIAADAMRNTLLGHYLDHQLHGAVTEFLTAWADRPKEEICSKLVALAMHQPEFIDKGFVSWPPAQVMPANVFEDNLVFEPGAVELLP